jgi:16S rRNA processing protein RimM
LERRKSPLAVARQIILKRTTKKSSDASLSLDAAYDQLVGKVVGLFGLKGFLKVRPETNNPSVFENIKRVAFKIGPQIVEKAEVDDIRFNKQIFEISLKNCPTRTSVEHLVNATVLTSKDQLAALDENEWWTSDLIGIEVFTTEGRLVGTICNTLGKQGEFLEVRRLGGSEDDTILIPFVKQLVPLVDINSRRIEVVDLPGLLDGSGN